MMSYLRTGSINDEALQAARIQRNVEVHCHQQRVKSRSLAVLIAGMVHALLVGVALLIGFAGTQEREPELIINASPHDLEERPRKKELSQASTRQRPAPPSSRATKVISAASPAAVTVPLIEQQVDDPTALLGTGVSAFGDGFGMGGAGSGMGAGQFFGVQSKGNKFVYVIDGSTSMRRSRKWETCKRELISSIRRLSSQQRFYVYIFSREKVRMFDSSKVPGQLELATTDNINKFISWLEGYQLQSGTYPKEAVAEAWEKLNPDVIFLLSDGQFASGDDTEAFVLRSSKRRAQQTKINTIGFQTQSGEEVLRRIAEATGGEYRYVER